MKNIIFFLFTVAAYLLFNSKIHAQSGWQWAKNATSINSGVFDTYQSVTDRAGNIFFDGMFEGDSIRFGSSVVHSTGFKNLYQQLVIAEMDNSGNYKWALGTAGPAFTSTTSLKMKTDAGGNLFVLATYDGSSCKIGGFVLANPLFHNMAFLVKVSPTGTVLWAKNIGAISGNGSIGIDGTGDVYIAATFILPTLTIDAVTLENSDKTGASGDVFVVRMSESGVAKWGKRFGSQANDDVVDMTVSKSGNIYLFARNYLDSLITIDGALTVDSTYYFVKYDNSGNALSVKNYSDADAHPAHIILGPTERIYACGADQNDNLAMIKYDETGGILYTQIATEVDGFGKLSYDIALDLCGNIWTCGSMATSNQGLSGYGISFPGYTLYSPPGSYDPMYIARYDTSGNYVSSLALPSGGEDWNSIAVDNQGNFIVSGDYVKGLKIGFGKESLYTSVSAEDLFIAKYKYDNINCDPYVAVEDDMPLQEDVMIYPNPSSGVITIALPLTGSGWHTTLTDVFGKVVMNNSYAGNIISMDPKVPHGLYFLKVMSMDHKQMFIRKIIRE